jgi:hypothetical protein
METKSRIRYAQEVKIINKYICNAITQMTSVKSTDPFVPKGKTTEKGQTVCENIFTSISNNFVV